MMKISKIKRLFYSYVENTLPYLAKQIDFWRAIHLLEKEIKMSAEYNIPIFDRNLFNHLSCSKRKKIFILGSGQSINEIPSHSWREISKNISIGINQWFLHTFDPDFYIFEGFSEGHQDRQSFSKWLEYHNQLIKYSRETNSIFLLKDIATSSGRWNEFSKNRNKNSFIIPKLFVPGRNIKNFNHNIIQAKKNASKYDAFLFRRGSISLALDLAIKMNPEEIILCGVDLNGSKYFWEKEGFVAREGYSLPKVESPIVHGTMTKEVDPITLDIVITAFNEELVKRKEIKLYCGSVNSILSKSLPVYPWPES